VVILGKDESLLFQDHKGILR